MKLPVILTVLMLALVLRPASVQSAASAGIGPEEIQQNLAKVPASDPAAIDVPKLLDSVKGKHPRLLFNETEIADLKSRIASDPVLKKTSENIISWAKKLKIDPHVAKDLVSNDTPALSTGAGQYPSLAYAYALNRDPAIKKNIIDVLNMMLDEPHWSTGAELDASMGAACNMYMVAILYDTVYNDLDPELRAKVAQKLLVHARRLYYLGYKQLSLMPIKYWQQDPQPNHRWYRGRAQAASLLALIDEKEINAGFLLQEIKKEMDFVMKWYPADGDCHEGAAYQVFGFRELLEEAMIFDRTLGTKYLENPGFKNAFAMQLYYWVPGRGSALSFGDAQNNSGQFMYDDAPFFISSHLSRDKNVQAALFRRFEKLSKPKDPSRPRVYPWSLLSFYDPTVGEGDYKALPTFRLFADLGAVSMRDSWEDDGVILTFKCGPYGGYKLNEYRQTTPDEQGNPHYINIAHDDPDANSIAMAMGDEFIFHPGIYATKKTTDTISSITVDGKGQIMEGDDYTQPVPKVDMRTLSYLTSWKADNKGRIIVEGEAGNAYRTCVKNVISDSVLKKFRRSTLWMPGEYILILDDIVGDGPRQMTWRGTVEKGQFIKPEEGRCQIQTKGGKQIDLQILGNKPFKGAVDYIYLAGRWGSELLQQLQFSAQTDSIKFACLIDSWKKKPTLTLKEDGEIVTLTVHSESFDDTWTWKSAKDAHTPSLIECKRGGETLITLTEKDKASQTD